MNYTLHQKRGIFGWHNNKLNKNEKKMIKVKLINKANKNEDIEKNETEIEINNTESIANLIKNFCKTKKIEKNNFYLTKKDHKKIGKNLTLKEAKISDNETLFIFEGNEEDNEDNNQIKFYVNYLGKNYPCSGSKDKKFSDCIKSFIEENGDNKFIFIFNEKIINKGKSLSDLKIENENVVKVGQFK